MSQGFIFGQPATRAGLTSQFVRANFDAIGTLNAGPDEPLNPEEGMPWLDTTDAPTAVKLKVFIGSAFQVIAEFPFTSLAVSLVRFPISTATALWEVIHNLGKPSVSVTLFNISGKVIEALDIDVTDVNKAVVTHAYPLVGSALVVG